MKPTVIEKGRWLEVNWPLNEGSIVFDIGGYCGSWTEATSKRFPGNYYVFEPVFEFYQKTIQALLGRKNIFVFNFGLGFEEKQIEIGVENDASTGCFYKNFSHKVTCKQQSINSVFPAAGVDLMAINAEGAEFEILRGLFESGNISKTYFLQIQFHNFVPDYAIKYNKACQKLSKTHERIYLWEDVWEIWMLKESL